MMDPFDRLAGPAADLLGRVDDRLVRDGAPDEHRIWPLLRRVGALPGEAVDALAALQAAPLAMAGSAVRRLAGEYDDARAAATTDPHWEGAGAEAFAARRAALAARLGGGPDSGDPESLAGRLDATAAYLIAVADWVAWCRAALARTLADVLASAEAVTVVVTRGGSGVVTSGGSGSAIPGALAAADIGARVLATVTEAYDRGEVLLRRWAPELAEVAVHRADEVATRADSVIRITF